MGLSVTTIAPTMLLSTVARIKTEFGILVATYDALIDTLLRQAGAMAQTYCQRVFPRQVYTESAPGFGGPYFRLRHAPVVVLTSSKYDGSALSDVSIAHAEEGLLYRQSGFDWTAQVHAGLQAGGLWMDIGMPIPLSEEELWEHVYAAGWIVPAQDKVSIATISAAAADDSFNDSASGFPSLLKAGDIIETSGFSNAANNGRFVVTGTPTTAKIIVDGSLVDEAAAAGRTLLVSNLPGDIERGVIEIVKSLYANRATDSNIIEKQAAVMRLRYSEGRASEHLALPPSALGLLRPYVRTY